MKIASNVVDAFIRLRSDGNCHRATQQQQPHADDANATVGALLDEHTNASIYRGVVVGNREGLGSIIQCTAINSNDDHSMELNAIRCALPGGWHLRGIFLSGDFDNTVDVSELAINKLLKHVDWVNTVRSSILDSLSEKSTSILVVVHQHVNNSIQVLQLSSKILPSSPDSSASEVNECSKCVKVEHEIIPMNRFEIPSIVFRMSVPIICAKGDALSSLNVVRDALLSPTLLFYIPSIYRLIEYSNFNSSVSPDTENFKCVDQLLSNVSPSSVAANTMSDIVEVEWMRASDSIANETPPVLSIRIGEQKLYVALLSVIYCAFGTDSVLSALSSLAQSMSHQIDALISSFTLDEEVAASNSSCVLHFSPSLLPHPITLVYPLSHIVEPKTTQKSANYQEIMLTLRKIWAKRLVLPMDRPFFRLEDAVLIPKQLYVGNIVDNSSKRLLNVHLSLLTKSDVQGGKEYCIWGNYLYYHYLQDRFNDNQWGCAYRTLQSICNWFVMQHYLPNEPLWNESLRMEIPTQPTHADIQRVLVALGDKPNSFVGSREWIGAIEVGMFLNALNIESRTLFVSEGRDVCMHSRTLASHFENEGTPVMIGGGVLAYGLLGISWNEKTGESKYLILDPHYTGADQLASVLKNQWCAWKSADIFLPDKYYNFCLPMRPKLI